MKEALERKPAVEQRKQEAETRKQAVGERILVYIAIEETCINCFYYFSDFFDFLVCVY